MGAEDFMTALAAAMVFALLFSGGCAPYYKVVPPPMEALEVMGQPIGVGGKRHCYGTERNVNVYATKGTECPQWWEVRKVFDKFEEDYVGAEFAGLNLIFASQPLRDKGMRIWGIAYGKTYVIVWLRGQLFGIGAWGETLYHELCHTYLARFGIKDDHSAPCFKMR